MLFSVLLFVGCGEESKSDTGEETTSEPSEETTSEPSEETTWWENEPEGVIWGGEGSMTEGFHLFPYSAGWNNDYVESFVFAYSNDYPHFEESLGDLNYAVILTGKCKVFFLIKRLFLNITLI